jgi:DNA-binding transcriptional MerR regulator
MRVPRNTPMYPMRTVVKLTGVDAHRIRYWESKYGFPSPTRDGKGRRLYTALEVDLIRKVGNLTDSKGLSLAAIWDLVNQETEVGSLPELGGEVSLQ